MCSAVHLMMPPPVPMTLLRCLSGIYDFMSNQFFFSADISFFIACPSQTPAEGASITIFAAAASELEGVGSCYLYNGQKRQSANISYDSELQAKLWKKSCELAGL